MIHGPLKLYSHTDWDDEPEEYVDPTCDIDHALQLKFIESRPLYEVKFEFYYDDETDEWTLRGMTTGSHTLGV